MAQRRLTSSAAPQWRRLHIAMIGQKGLPATYGGIEHHVEELGRRLVDRGHRVTVFNRDWYGELPPSPYLGMEVRRAPTLPSKHLDAILHSASSTVLAIGSRCDIVHYHALGPGLLSPVPRVVGRAAVVQTVHGLDHERGKWSGVAKAALGAAHWVSGHAPDRTVVVSQALRDHYGSQFGRDAVYIPNGVVTPQPASADLIRDTFGLVPGGYVLFVGRLVPEKAPDLLLQAYRQLPGDTRLVIAGGSSFTDDFERRLTAMAAQDPRVLMTGYVFGAELRSLYQHARLFVQPSLLEGLPLTLLEAASHGLPVLASDIAPHHEVLGKLGPGRRTFASGDLDSLVRALAEAMMTAPDESAAAQELKAAVLERYSWDQAAEALERVYLEVAPRAGRRARRHTAVSASAV